MKRLNEIRKSLGGSLRKIAARVDAILAEEFSLQELRKAHRLTQKAMARKLKIGQSRRDFGLSINRRRRAVTSATTHVPAIAGVSRLASSTIEALLLPAPGANDRHDTLELLMELIAIQEKASARTR